MSTIDQATERFKKADREYRAAALALQEAMDTTVVTARLAAPKLAPGPSAHAKVVLIQKLVTEYHGVPMDVLLSDERTNRVARPRHQAMVIARTLLGLPVEFIGTLFNRHHGTVTFSERAVEARCELEADYKREYDALLALCEAALIRMEAA